MKIFFNIVCQLSFIAFKLKVRIKVEKTSWANVVVAIQTSVNRESVLVEGVKLAAQRAAVGNV